MSSVKKKAKIMETNNCRICLSSRVNLEDIFTAKVLGQKVTKILDEMFGLKV